MTADDVREPTTEQVRETWVAWSNYGDDELRTMEGWQQVRGEWFDAWLARREQEAERRTAELLGWQPFGSHAGDDPVPQVVFAGEDEAGMPLWERVITDGREAYQRVLGVHVKDERMLCGATTDAPHRHYSENRRSDKAYPVRPLTCTKWRGHGGLHQDSICCWNFEPFEDATGQRPDEQCDRSVCTSCHTTWPCPTIAALAEILPTKPEPRT